MLRLYCKACYVQTIYRESDYRLPGDHSEREPPDSISNSEVKTLSADGSVRFPHVRVGHRQVLNSSIKPQLGI